MGMVNDTQEKREAMTEPQAKILVVDDEEEILLLLKRLLEAKGFEVRTATNTSPPTW